MAHVIGEGTAEEPLTLCLADFRYALKAEIDPTIKMYALCRKWSKVG